MSRSSITEAKLNALADYLGVEFAVRDDKAMCVKNEDSRCKLSEADIEEIVDALCKDKRYNDAFTKRIDLLKQYLQIKLTKQIKFTVEDQAKLAAISEIMKANYYGKLKKMEEE